ncbi:ATPdependent RNA helicase [Perkinsus olseni]|uniref:ATP-dependent RNA helicase n=1 Tax=Perkinsus olseni TaxID=32597 RepID=A0A7J6M5A6_PEROL|nr:ATPdependent RNA helicase [Perkinsus olseni]
MHTAESAGQKETRRMGLRHREDAEIADLENRLIIECPREGESVDQFERRRGLVDAEGEEHQRFTTGPVLTGHAFGELPLSRKTQLGLKDHGFTKLTPIQRSAIPYALAGRDVLGEARTGSGKSLAFIIPVIEKLYRMKWSADDGVGAVLISPTRELSAQIFTVLQQVGSHHDFSAGCVVGGRKFQEEQKVFPSLSIVVCTPGRLLQHIEETAGSDLSNVQVLVLDEADRILDLGFKRTVELILDALPPKRQTLLFSATMRTSVQQLATLALDNPELLSVSRNLKSATPTGLRQLCMTVRLEEKVNSLFTFLKTHAQTKIIAFVSATKQVRFLYETFRRLRPGLAVLELHGGMSLDKRMKVFDQFASKDKGLCLICTDVAARGVDFPQVDWVIQVDAPDTADTYIHRVGRTARFDREGNALMFATEVEQESLLSELAQKKVDVRVTSINRRRMFNITGKLQSLLASEPEVKHLAIKATQVYARSVALAGRTKLSDDEVAAYAHSLGLHEAPPVTLPTQEELTSGKKKKNMSKLERLKEKIRQKKLAKKQKEMAGEAGEGEEDGGWSQLEEDLQEKKATKLSKFERRQKRQQELFAAQGPDGLSGEAQEGDEEDDVLVTVNKGDDAPLEEEPATQAEARARDAVKKGRLRVRKDGSIYVRGTGGLGKNQHMTFDESGDEGSEREEAQEDEDEESAAAAKKAFVESMRQKVEEREEEDKKLMQEKVREKHRKIKEKLRRKRPEGEDEMEEVGAVLASPEEDSDTAEDHDGEGSVEPPAKRQRGEMADLEAEALKLLG